MYSRRAIGRRMVTAASRLIDLALEPVDNILVKPDSDSGLARRGAYHGPRLSLPESPSFLTGFPGTGGARLWMPCATR